EQSADLGVVMGVFWSFGLAVLFLLSGVGARFALRRRTWQAFLRERVARLVVPFVVAGVLVLSPVQAYIEAVHKGYGGGPFLEFAVRWIGTALNPLDWTVSPTLFGRGYHLWFLGFLFAISVIALPLLVGLMSRLGRSLVDAIARALAWRGTTLVAAVPIVILMSIGVFLGTAEHDWFELWWYFAYFVIGFILVSDDRFLAAVRRDGWVALATALGSTAVLTMTPAAGLLDSMTDGLDVPHLLAGVLFGLEGWAWTLVILNLGLRVARLQRPVAPHLNEAVLPVYVVHQPVILAVAFFVVGWPVGLLAKWLVVFGASAAITLALVEVGLRFRVTRALLGAKVQPLVARVPPVVRVPGARPIAAARHESRDPVVYGEPIATAGTWADPRHA
ncbi:MAG TPA: acyltransferase family protein, partial [Candidatus Limnocylindrales bacterium]|nr:acyltransferase family protein [Candidatus Limnocylindrales bacterium]